MKFLEGSTVIPIIIPTNSMLKTFNCYLIKTNKELTLVDAAIDDDEVYALFLKELKINGLSVSDITQIVLTHNHSDHTGLVKRIRAETTVKVYAHPSAHLRLMRDEDFLLKRIDFFDKLYNESGCGERGKLQVKRIKDALVKNSNLRIEAPILPIVEGDIINGFKVMELPGHSIDHIALYKEITGELISGDHILEHASSNALVEMDLDGELLQTLYLYYQSLKRCEQLNLNVIYPGHGIIVREECNELFTKRINAIIRKSKRVKATIVKEEQTASKLAKDFYKERYDTLFVLVMSEVIGHLERLVIKGELIKTYKGSVYIYSENKN